jgi:hypothetical protein
VRLQNTHGKLASAPWEFCINDGDEVLLFTETWLEGTPPSISGFVRRFGAARPRGASAQGPRGGVAAYVADGVGGEVAVWKERPADGVLWIQLAWDAQRPPLMLGVCYLPPQGSGGCPTRGALTEWFETLAEEVTEARGLGPVILAGDFNARVAEEPDFPDQLWEGEERYEALDDGATGAPRTSVDPKTNSHGRSLLELCKSTGMRILNGRTPGDVPAAITSLGPGSESRSVIDLVLACPYSLAAVERLEVLDPMVVPGMDHKSVSLVLAGEGTRGAQGESAQGQRSAPPVPADFYLQPHLLPAFADHLSESVVIQQLAAVQAMVLRGDAGDLDSAAAALDTVVVAALEAAGMQRRAPRQPGWLRRVRREPAIQRQLRAVRKERRRAVREPHLAAAAAARAKYRQLQRRQQREVRRMGGKKLEDLLRADPKEFYRRYRQRPPPPPSAISAAQFGRHFKGVLGGKPPDQPIPPADPSYVAPQGLPQGPLNEEELLAAIKRVKNSSSVLGILKPQMLKAAAAPLVPVLVSLFAACVRVGRLPETWALSAITAIHKPGSNPLTCDGYRGIAVGTLLAKVYASALECRMSSWAEAHGVRAAGQFGFRRGKGAAHAAFVTRTLVDQAHAAKVPLYALFIDFRKAYDSVPRHLLWAKLERRGVCGWVLDAVKTLYGAVPMCVKTCGGFSDCFASTVGVKQGCPLSPLLFGLFIDDFEEELLAALQAAGTGNPSVSSHGLTHMGAPLLQGSPVHCVLYADDLLLMALSARGLRCQAAVLEAYAARWGLTVNASKTKVLVFRHRRDQQLEKATKIRIGGQTVEVVDGFTYLGVEMRAGAGFLSEAVAARRRIGLRAMYGVSRQRVALQLESPDIQCRLFDVFVESVLSYGVEVWGPGVLAGEDPCKNAAEQVQLLYLRRLLGVRGSTASRVVLAECGRWPLALRWVKRLTKFYNNLLDEPEHSLLRRALKTSVEITSGKSWANQFAVVLESCGVEMIPDQPLDVQKVVKGWQHWYLCDTCGDNGTKKKRYFTEVRGGLEEEPYDSQVFAAPEYLEVVSRRGWRRALTQLRTGAHWLGVETGTWGQTDAAERQRRERCTSCSEEGLHVLEDVPHMLFHCPRYAVCRARYPSLFETTHTVCTFFQQSPAALASFAKNCYDHFTSS